MPTSTKLVFDRIRPAALAGVLGTAMAFTAGSASASGLDPAGRATLSRYTVTETTLGKVLSITRAAKAKGIRTDDGINLAGQTASIDDMAKAVDGKPVMMALIKAQGMTARQFVLGDLALMQGAMAASGGAENQMAEKLLGKPNAANIAFYNSHKKLVSSLLAMANGESGSTATPQLSEKDKRELAAIRKMGPEKFKECTKMALVVPATTYTFTVGVQDSLGPTQPEPGSFAKLGKILENLSANVPDRTPSEALQKMGRQIELQEGHRPARVTPAFTAASQELGDWLDKNCKPRQAKKAEESLPGSGTGSAGAVPATAPKPVPKIVSDAPGVMFGQLSAADMAVLNAARGIQMGGMPGPADIQIIFDPNAPYGARLYQQLHKTHPDLAVRWVPIAYISKNSATLAEALLTSRTPQQDLNTDLLYYNFAKRHGGVQPGSDASGTLPPEQLNLRKAWVKWGGYTPMTIFKDQSDRWLRIGGSGVKVIDSVLARAAK